MDNDNEQSSGARRDEKEQTSAAQRSGETIAPG
jgi:hypothetical protein